MTDSYALPSVDPIKLPEWKHPYYWDYSEGPGDMLTAHLKTDTEIMVSNMLEMMRAAEDEEYLNFITKVLALRGYTVTKEDTSDKHV